MRLAVLCESNEHERRVAVTPSAAERLAAAGHDVVVERSAGAGAGFSDARYEAAGATITDRLSALGRSDLVVAINGHIDGLSEQHTVIGLFDPLWRPDNAAALAASGATLISLELIPRITRAQSMDVLSSMATVAGSQAVLLGALESPKMMPLMMTAAGTVPAARVLILGAGVAGLQAIATARRLGAIVTGYDIRPAAAEQIRSLGAKAVELEIDSIDRTDDGGYAKEQSEDAAAELQKLLESHVADADLVITTAAIPGAASPLLVTTDMIHAMQPGAVIIDMAAERGGNAELTEVDQRITVGGVTILGPSDLASRAATTASEMFATNVVNLLAHLCDDDGELTIDPDDEITAGVVIASGGALVHPRLAERPDTTNANEGSIA